MATLNEIVSGLANTIKNYTAMDIFAYNTVADMANFPAIMVEPSLADFQLSFGPMDVWTLRVYVLCATGSNAALAQQQLNQLVTGWGANSIRQVVHEHGDLGLAKTESVPLSVTAYGGSFTSASVPAVGAIINVRVTTEVSG